MRQCQPQKQLEPLRREQGRQFSTQLLKQAKGQKNCIFAFYFVIVILTPWISYCINLCNSLKKNCGLSKTGPYNLELLCEPVGSWAKEILKIFLLSKLQKNTYSKNENPQERQTKSQLLELSLWTEFSYSPHIFSIRNATRYIRLRYLHIYVTTKFLFFLHCYKTVPQRRLNNPKSSSKLKISDSFSKWKVWFSTSYAIQNQSILTYKKKYTIHIQHSNIHLFPLILSDLFFLI